MKKLLLIPAIALMASCCNFDEEVSNMKSPVILMAKSDGRVIVLKDSTGRVETYANCGQATAVCWSRNIGDTIK